MLTTKAAALGLMILASSFSAGKLTYDFINDPYLGPMYFPQYQQSNGW